MHNQVKTDIILDSISEEGIRLTTWHLRVPRCIWPEFLTHRVFSRNGRSSRAVPVKTMIQEIKDDPFVPWHWGKNQPGMQANEELDALIFIENSSYPYKDLFREEAWILACGTALKFAEAYMEAGYHKQIVNRLLEPFMWIDVVITATEWDNFFDLRTHGDAEPHFRDIARQMKTLYDKHIPTELPFGEWHLPYVTKEEQAEYDINSCIKLSVARCARISYKSFDGNDSLVKEFERFDKLVGSDPKHYSPFEHQATPDTVDGDWLDPDLWGNFRGWVQARKLDEFKLLN